MAKTSRRAPLVALPKSPTGIQGFDEITGGGLPTGRPTLVCGGPGCGKTLFAMEFLMRGATQFGESGVFMSFEEGAADIAANVASLGFGVEQLVAEKRLYVDHVHIERSEIEETGEYDLEGLFVRLGHAVNKVGAKRVALDTLEALFSGFQNTGILRAELRRLFRWLKERGLTAVITAERGDNLLTRYGLEEYVSDCVIALDHRVNSQISTRRLRIVKYRGSSHGTNEYPFLIDGTGFAVMPITSVGLTHEVSDERVSTGVAGLDEMLGGQGIYRGSTLMVSGTAGTGKTMTGVHFAKAAADRGERALFFTFEESPSQLMRNARSVGIDLGPAVKKHLLCFHSARPTLYGLEAHLARMLHDIRTFEPRVVVVDPMNALSGTAPEAEVRAVAMRLIDWLKDHQITGFFTTLSSQRPSSTFEASDIGISSVVDTWVLLRHIEWNGERNRGIYILKSRGMAHSNQIREFQITESGVRLVDAYFGPDGVLTGSARLTQEAQARTAAAEREGEMERQRRRAVRKRAVIEAQITALRAELEAEQAEVDSVIAAERVRRERAAAAEREIALSRHVEVGAGVRGETTKRRSGRARVTAKRRQEPASKVRNTR